VGHAVSASVVSEILSDLGVMANARVFEGATDAWTYGWCDAAYRRDPGAAIRTAEGRVRVAPDGVEAYERAMTRLRSMPHFTQRWDDEELWGVVAEMVATLPPGAERSEPQEGLRERLDRLLSVAPSLVAFAVANVAWEGQPALVADAVVGIVDQRWLDAIKTAAKQRPTLEPPQRAWWLNKIKGRASGAKAAIGFAAWVPACGQRAIAQAEQRFEDILSVELLLLDDPRKAGLTPLRGDSHKPGVRGLTLHRPALARNRLVARELGAEILLAGPAAAGLHVQWYGEDPFPLDGLLRGPNSPSEISSIVLAESTLYGRIRTAARWLSKAHWAYETEDAALALGIALDALLAESGPSPGRVLTERFALLEPDSSERAARAARMDALYGVRSSVAHGGRSSLLDQAGFIGGMAADVRWVARRLLVLSQRATVRSEKDHRALFDALKWGTLRGP